MKPLWFLGSLLYFLAGTSAESSLLSSGARTETIDSQVGNQVVLPCCWKQRLAPLTPSSCHVQWRKPLVPVFELWGQSKWQAEAFKGRAEVPEEKLGSGNCSLIISDVQISDAGSYQSFMVVDGLHAKRNRVFIQGVRLAVFDHKSMQSLGLGEDLVLDLHTRHTFQVVFQGRDSAKWTPLWTRDDEDSERLQRNTERNQLRIKNLRASDEGTYKVLDESGHAVGTVLLSVEERSTPLHRFHENQIEAGDAARSSSSALLSFSLLVTCLQILHLL